MLAIPETLYSHDFTKNYVKSVNMKYICKMLKRLLDIFFLNIKYLEVKYLIVHVTLHVTNDIECSLNRQPALHASNAGGITYSFTLFKVPINDRKFSMTSRKS